MAKPNFNKKNIDFISSTCDPTTAWKEGILGFLLNKGVVYTAFIIDIFGIPTLMSMVSPGTGIVFGIVLTSVIAILVVIRHYRVVSCRVDMRTHQLIHIAREYTGKICDGKRSNASKIQTFRELNIEIANSVATIFSEKVFYWWYPDTTIGCIIKLYNGNGSEGYYRTVARSSKIDMNRSLAPTLISKNEGLGKHIRKYQGLGVHIIRDLEEAIQKGIWIPSPHDDKEDIQTRMIAPINSYQNGIKHGIGMVFITSAKSMQFSRRDALAVMGIADFLGILYSTTLGSISKASQHSDNGSPAASEYVISDDDLEEIKWQLKEELLPSVKESLRKELLSEVENSLKTELQPKVEEHLKQELNPKVEESLKKELHPQVEESLKEQLRPDVEAELILQLTSNLKNQPSGQKKKTVLRRDLKDHEGKGTKAPHGKKASQKRQKPTGN